MIVVHPEDPSTWMLELIYRGIADVVVYDSWLQREEILRAIASAPKDETIFLLGHGSSAGLLDKRYGLLIRDEDASILTGRPNLVGIWCYASDYARTHRLQGFFSGMFISEEDEAAKCGVNAHGEEIEGKAVDFAQRFGSMLRTGTPMSDIATELMDTRHRDSELTLYNYSRLVWRPTGKEL